MKTSVKYRYEPTYNRDFNSERNLINKEIQVKIPSDSHYLVPVLWREESKSQVVNIKCEEIVQQVFDLVAPHKHHLGFSFPEVLQKNAPGYVMVAKKLGKSYHPIKKEIKGRRTPKNNNIMKTFDIKRILVPTDFSQTGTLAIEHAAYMAKLFKAHLYLLHVIESFEYAYSEFGAGALLRDSQGVEYAASERLERLAAELGNHYGINVTPLVNTGLPAKGISKTGKDLDIDLIIMGTHGAKGFEEIIIGSNAHKVVNYSPCPVITIQETAKNVGFTNIVMPIDNSEHSRQKVDYVIEVAKRYGSKIHILGLLETLAEEEERKFNIKLDAVEHVIKQTELPYVRKFVTGHNVAVEAMKYSDEVNADLLVIMTDHDESSLSGPFLGPLAKQVVNHSKIPVMSIHPVEHYRAYSEQYFID